VTGSGTRVGIVGAGAMGATHARLLCASVPGAAVVAVCDAVAARAERLAAEIAGGVRVLANGFELIGCADVDAVLVASPGATHAELVLACLDAGKPVLCEKPLATTASDALRVVEAEAALGRRLVQVGFMRRFDPGYVDMKAALDAGAIGAPLLAYSIHRNAMPPPGFGTELILRDTVVHDVDAVRWLLGQELIAATVLTPRPSPRVPDGVLDPLLVLFETDAGALVQVEAFVHAQYGYDIRCELVGEVGALALAPPATVALRRDGREGIAVPMSFQKRFAPAYVSELRHWLASVVDGVPAGASAWDGYAAVAVCEAAVESLLSGSRTEVASAARPALYAG
jgi:myo-inositol 2-dehydrogenase/D-chiro-inositol 1-dehydrogenase